MAQGSTLAVREQTHTLVAQSEALPDDIQQVVLTGDLGRLDPNARALYYLHVCRTIGVNPATRPFEFTVLNGKTVLYARRDCTDQLRSLKRVSVQIVSREQIGDLFAVTARAEMPDGRKDESVGVVPLGQLRGDAAANALMKAETKAKRRVTLSICGLGFTDESDLETIPNRRDLNDTPVARFQDDNARPETRTSEPAIAPGEDNNKAGGTAGTAMSPKEKLKATVLGWAGVRDPNDKRAAMYAVFDACGVSRPKKDGDTSDDDIERMIAWCEERQDAGVNFTDAVAKKVDPVDEAPKDKQEKPKQEPEARWPEPAKASPAQVAYWRRQLVQKAGLWKQSVKYDEHMNSTPEDLVRHLEQVEKLPKPGQAKESDAAMKYKEVAQSESIDWSQYVIPF